MGSAWVREVPSYGRVDFSSRCVSGRCLSKSFARTLAAASAGAASNCLNGCGLVGPAASRAAGSSLASMGASVEDACPGCGLRVPALRKHMKKCCPERLPERLVPVDDEEQLVAARRGASEADWITEEEVRICARRSFDEVHDPLLRRVLALRFGADRGGERRTPSEVANALGGKYAGNGQACLNLIRKALRSVPLVADDPSNLEVLYEDEVLLAVSKPPFLRSTPVHRFVGKSLTNQLVGHILQNSRSTQESRERLPLSQPIPPVAPLLLHRLDQTTSGVVLCAKTKAAASFLQGIWHGPQCRKEYLAVVRPPAVGAQLAAVGDSVIVDAPIGKDVSSSDPVRRAVNFVDGQTASTRLEVLATATNGGKEVAMLLSCVLLESGRTHQIRVHAAHVGLPLLGDGMYGQPESEEPRLGRVALHAWRLHVLHPQSKRQLLLEAPLSADLQRCFVACGFQWPIEGGASALGCASSAKS